MRDILLDSWGDMVLMTIFRLKLGVKYGKNWQKRVIFEVISLNVCIKYFAVFLSYVSLIFMLIFLIYSIVSLGGV